MCGASPVEKVLFPVAVHFKGSGFYSTDYGRGGARGASKDGESSGSERRRSGKKKPAAAGPKPRRELRDSRSSSPRSLVAQPSRRVDGRRRGSRARTAGPAAAAAAPSAREHRDRGDVVLGPEDHGLAADRRIAAEPAVERVSRVRAEVRPAELHQLPGAEVGRERRDEVVADERQLHASVPCDLSRIAATTPAAAVAPGRSRSRRVEQVLADARVDERTSAVHVLLALARTASRATRCSAPAVLYGQSNLFERIGRGTFTSMPPTASISSSNRSKSTKATWLRPAGEILDGAERERRAADLVGRVDLRRPTSGISTCRSRGIERNARRCRFRVGAEEHDRVGPVRRPRGRRASPSVPSTRIVVGVETSRPSYFESSRRTPAAARSFASSTPPRNGK